jgi:hypothetical protein
LRIFLGANIYRVNNHAFVLRTFFGAIIVQLSCVFSSLAIYISTG